MKSLRFYGASDDLIEVEGDVPGADEYPGEATSFTVAGLQVGVRYFTNGVWGIILAQVDEDVPITAQDLRFSVHESGYSMQLDMDVPDDAYVTKREVA